MGKYYAFYAVEFRCCTYCAYFRRSRKLDEKSGVLGKELLLHACDTGSNLDILLRMGISIELAIRSYPLGIFSIIEAIAGSMVIISIAKLLNKSKVITVIFSWIGRNSMIILGIHCLELMYFNWEKYIFDYMPFTMNWFRVFIIKSIFILSLTGVICLYQKNEEFLSRIFCLKVTLLC